MDMATLSNNLLDVFYMFIGLCMAITMVFTLKDKNHKTRIGTALFWNISIYIYIRKNTSFCISRMSCNRYSNFISN